MDADCKGCKALEEKLLKKISRLDEIADKNIPQNSKEHKTLFQKIAELERHEEKANYQNAKEHNDILASMEKVITNMNWIKTIGNFILVTMLGYFVGIGYYIITAKYATKEEMTQVMQKIQAGEDLHFENERIINRIDGKLEILIEHTKLKD